MTQLYLRKVVLDFLPNTGSPQRLEDFRISFDCKKTNESTPNEGKISIYNLSEKTRSLFEAEKTRVALLTGYLGVPDSGIVGPGESSGNVDVIFVGDVKKVIHEIDDLDIITQLEVTDGGNRYRASKLDKGYPPNTKFSNVLDDLTNAMGLSKGIFKGIGDKKFANGLTLSGMVRDHFDFLTKTEKLEWSIQDEKVQVIPRNETDSESSYLTIGPDSGLIDSPSKTEKGVQFKSLIQPILKPGLRVKLESKFISGFFKLRTVTHNGDSRDGDFLSECEATKLE